MDFIANLIGVSIVGMVILVCVGKFIEWLGDGSN